MTDTQALRDLEKRLMEATGANFDLDKAIFLTIDEGFGARITGHAYTASLDAAIALCERMLPGWRWLGDRDDDRSPLFAFRVKQRGERWDDARPCYAATPALALCLAIVRALLAKETE